MTTVRLTNTVLINGVESQDPAVTPAQGSSPPSLIFSAYNVQANGVDLDRPVVDLSHTLSGATGSVDLTAAPLARDIGQTFDLSGVTAKLHSVIISADGDNTAAITVGEGASNGFPLLGSGGEVTLEPGATLALVGPSDGAVPSQAVDATHKILDIAGTSGDIVYILAYFDSGA